jgi:predicted nucleic acid-binding protein
MVSGEWEWLGSPAITAEIRKTPDEKRRKEMLLLTEQIGEKAIITPDVAKRVRELEKVGFKAFDAMHLACAEYIQADVFLTTDDRLLRAAARSADELEVPVMNPLDWLLEVMK